MPTPLRRRLRHARRFFGYGALVVVVLVALLVGIANQLLPLAERNPQRVAAWLSERAGRPVHFSALDTEWTRRGPVLRLDDLRIGEGASSFLVGDTEMLVSLYAGLLPGRTFTELRLRGLDITVQRDDDGQWSVRGLPGQQQTTEGDPFAALERLGELQVIGGRLHVVAPSLSIDATVPRIDLRLRVEGDRIRSGLRAWMRPNVSPLDATLDFDRKQGDGRAYAGAQKADLAVWAPLLKLMGVQAQAGRGRAAAWATLRDHRVADVTFQAALDAVALQGARIDGMATPPRARFDHVDAFARFRHTGGGDWRFDAPRLRLETQGNRQVLDGLVMGGGRRFGMAAERIDAGPLLQVAALSDRMDAGLRRWVVQSKPNATLEHIEVAGAHGVLRANARISALAFAPVGNSPGLSGLGGSFVADADGFVFDADSSAQMDFWWPAGFGVHHPATLRGKIAGWREGAGWRVGTDALKVTGSDFGVLARGGLWWQGDGTRPWIDIAADLDDSPVTAARGFLVRHLMADATEHWLDTALLSGTVHGGRAIITGDLDEWPFVHDNGLFRADAELVDMQVKFSPEWPAAEHLHGMASFIGNGFNVVGDHAVLQGVQVSKLAAGIAEYGKAELTVQASGASDASKLVALLQHSPLEKDQGETLDNITASGPAAVTFDMLLPMHPGGGKGRTHGTVDLQGAKLRENRWDLAFDDVRGRADYGDGGFAANALQVQHDGAPGTLALRAGTGFVKDASQAFEGELRANLDAKTLVDRAGNLAWLKPYLDGRSAWTIGVALPKNVGAKDAAPSKLSLRSNLVGTTLSLPAPLRKAAGVALATTVDTDLPMGDGEVRVALGNLAALRARTRGTQTGLRVVLGSNRVDDAPPASGLIATGRAASLDAIDWIALAQGDSNNTKKSGDGLALRHIDLRADRLLLLGGVFPDARLQVSPSATGSTVQVAGPALVGTVEVPSSDKGTISGRFDRAYWRAPPKTVATAATSPEEDPNPISPGSIPPLSFDVADLRLNALALGKATIRTHSTGDGLRFDTAQAQSAKHKLALTGEWSGQGKSARSNIGLRIDSQDFGALLDGLGFGGQLAGGAGTANFDAAWPGAPRDFDARLVDGRLALDVKEGRLLEIEPGAGRVLGLLSLAQLPKRMLLDFRDFYSKGLAFDTVSGHVRLVSGIARTDDLSIDGPAAQIHIHGTADLQAQTFDQTVEVLPRAGNLLTVAGAIAGGPVGAAIGAAANAVLKKPLGQLAAKTYRVTGPWKDPKVEVRKREPQGRASASADESTGG
ncbi:DUF3971 domain-containing protein [Lysobacter helvus]|uniref:DUF3971 domain-containing protein n=2 Tax=Lysobacteraceae TaxID=32033 RepID=A0ABM7Q6S8_9GAMM|nr:MULTISPECIES: YhdP family protein [Lysobacter]BCT93081.1 DUF3971 domain-containing protein [Lysobacter caseinilyticus]BCT96233.1 DUF3971 domain-containing protein [Lysobacter helvus]